MTWRIHVFGVRHLSPMGAWHLRDFLDRIRPELVLIEGLDDATGLLPDVTRKETKPPIAILAYTDSLPVRTLVYPFARYSPEYQAICWAHEHDVPVEFIDLPSDIFLGLQDREIERLEKKRRRPRAAPDEEPPAPVGVPEPRPSLYEQIADLAGERDYDTYWERHFEHNPAPDSYHGATPELGRAVRELEEDEPRWRAENLVREAYMRRRIEEAHRVGTQAGPDRRRRRRLSRPGADRRIPGHDRRGTGVAAAPVEQADAHAVFVLQAVVAVRLRGRQSRPGVFRAALGRRSTSTASATCPAAICRSSPATCATPARIARRPR